MSTKRDENHPQTFLEYMIQKLSKQATDRPFYALHPKPALPKVKDNPLYKIPFQGKQEMERRRKRADKKRQVDNA